MSLHKHSRLLRHGMVVRGKRPTHSSELFNSDVTEEWFWEFNPKLNTYERDTPSALLFGFLKSQYVVSGSVLSDTVVIDKLVDDIAVDSKTKASLVELLNVIRSETLNDNEFGFLRDEARDAFLRARVCNLSLTAVSDVGQDPYTVIDATIRGLTSLSSSVGQGASFDNQIVTLGAIAERIQRQYLGEEEDPSLLLSFPFYEWNMRLGGMKAGEVWVLAAQHNVGKSFLSKAIGYHHVEQGRKVVFHELEMLYSQIGLRFAAYISNLPINKIERRQLTPEEKTLLEASLDDVINSELEGNAIFVPGTQARTVAQLRQAIEARLGHERPDLIVVDFLTLLQPSGGSSQLSTWEKVVEVVKELKMLAMYMQCPVLTMIHLNRQDKTQFQSVDQLCDVVLSLEMSKDQPYIPPGIGEWVGAPGILECTVTRNRSGAKDITVHVEIEFATSSVVGVGLKHDASIATTIGGSI